MTSPPIRGLEIRNDVSTVTETGKTLSFCEMDIVRSEMASAAPSVFAASALVDTVMVVTDGTVVSISTLTEPLAMLVSPSSVTWNAVSSRPMPIRKLPLAKSPPRAVIVMASEPPVTVPVPLSQASKMNS